MNTRKMLSLLLLIAFSFNVKATQTEQVVKANPLHQAAVTKRRSSGVNTGAIVGLSSAAASALIGGVVYCKLAQLQQAQEESDAKNNKVLAFIQEQKKKEEDNLLGTLPETAKKALAHVIEKFAKGQTGKAIEEQYEKLGQNLSSPLVQKVLGFADGMAAKAISENPLEITKILGVLGKVDLDEVQAKFNELKDLDFKEIVEQIPEQFVGIVEQLESEARRVFGNVRGQAAERRVHFADQQEGVTIVEEIPSDDEGETDRGSGYIDLLSDESLQHWIARYDSSGNTVSPDDPSWLMTMPSQRYREFVASQPAGTYIPSCMCIDDNGATTEFMGGHHKN